MKATIGLELIGDNIRSDFGIFEDVIDEASGVPGLGRLVSGGYKPRSTCFEIVSFTPWETRNCPRKIDYSRANSKGSRGVYAWYTLESGHLYYIRQATSWKSEEVFYATVSDDGEIIKMTRAEAKEWIGKNTSG